MQIKDVLDLFLEQKYFASFSGTGQNIAIDLYVANFNCQLTISAPNHNEYLLSVLYIYDDNFQKSNKNFKYRIKNLEEITPYLDRILNEMYRGKNEFELHCHQHYFPAYKKAFPNNDKIREIFKLILAEKAIPTNYSFQIEKTEANPYGVIRLKDKDANLVHELNLKNVEISRPIKSLLSILDVQIDLQPIFPNAMNLTENIDFYFKIPGYELHKYPMLNFVNAINDTHDDLNDWIQEVIDCAPRKSKALQANLQSLQLNDNLSINNGTNQRKRKI